MTNRNFLFLILGLVLVGAIAIAGFGRGWFRNDGGVARKTGDLKAGNTKSGDTESADPEVDRPVKARTLSEVLGISEDEIVEVGGISRPRRDLKTESANSAANKPLTNPLPTAGKLPPLKGNENPQVARLFQELADPRGPKEAASAMFLPQEFDKERYFENPEEYLNQIRPGRVFKPANPGPDVVPITAASDRMSTLLQGERAILQVRASPNHPVTFYTPDGGEFDNRLKTISVSANDEGIAQAIYTAVPGTRGIMDVIAASPLHSGQVRFAVKVVLPDQ